MKFRRRREGKTNYYLRRELIKSGRPRLVVRKTNRYIIAQVVIAKARGDETVAHASSGELVRFGWKGGLKNIPAAYLTGLLVGYRALARGVREAILDIGLHRPVKGSRVFSALRGALDSGLRIPHGEDIFPSEDRMAGEHISKYANYLRERGYSGVIFSQYVKRGLDPTDLPRHFEEVKSRIIEYFEKVLKGREALAEAKGDK